jgi:hypothetical protein
MKKLIVVPALLLLMACQDHNPLQPAPELTPELALAQARGEPGDVVKMVPFRATGTWRLVGADFSGCGGRSDWVTTFVELVGTGTHLGGFSSVSENCWSTPDGGITWVYETQSGAIRASNGSLLYYFASLEEFGSTHPFYADNTWALGPVHFVGGTGRFAGADGVYSGWGTNNEEKTGGTFTLEGMISSVGSSR